MADVSVNGNTVVVKVTVEEGKGANPTAGKPKAGTSDAELSESADAKAIMGLGKQAAGYIPGVGEALGTIDTAVGAGKTISNAAGKGGVGPWAAVIALIMRSLKFLHDTVSQYVKDKRQSNEILKRAGNRRED